ncbi:Rft-1-domain-containing protein [Myriangium duriaei CBS 260.36]|uniref:Man(5)GlcNAc(2)-PP-dolichol translocation protein RFT1 n=1 Tax=Myriangium duriaei CBS 260.36 TaxID=1168546 RepID=A0A9P4JC55_9PEZI|nr:Rft-1-domain-containing protein [Myriangium duriaei CBS 260.36]
MMAETESATSAAAKGATYLMALQISSRALTFVLNQILLRFLTPDTLGRAVQLELYSISVLFFARESLRVAVQRVGVSDATMSTPETKTPDAEKKTPEKTRADKASNEGTSPGEGNAVQTVVNLSYLALMLGIPLTLGLGVLCQRALYASSQGLARSDPSNYINTSILLYGLAALIELASEPCFVAAQSILLFKVRAGAEAAATVGKTFATVLTAFVAYRLGLDIGVLPFAAGQVAYATVLLASYTTSMNTVSTQRNFHLLPHRFSNNPTFISGYFSRPLLTIATSLTIQSGIKYVLTQGDSILIAALASLQDQGTYALASNYGGLIARMLFQPIEEASRNLFAKLCSSTTQPSPANKAPSSSQVRAAHILTTILHLYALLALPALTLGPTLAPLLLSLVAGQRWTALGAGTVLGTYAYYIPLLATNGVTEAFVSAVASNRELYRQSVYMGAFFVAFAGSAWWFVARLGWGAEGIVWANCVNMAARIGYCFWFIGGYFRERGTEFDVLAAVPSAGSVAGAAAVPLLLRASEGMLSSHGVLGELVRVGGVGAVLAVVIGVSELGFFQRSYALIKRA